MHDLPRHTLCDLLAQYGPALCADPRRCEGLLRDFCGEQKREIFVLVSALRERVAVELQAAPAGVPHAVLLARLTQRLQANLALNEDAARWAVETWALALSLVTSADLGVRPPAPAAPSVGATAPDTSAARIDASQKLPPSARTLRSRKTIATVRAGWTLHDLIVSPDSRHVAYTASQRGSRQWHVIVDSQEGPPYDDIISSLVFSPDSRHVAYAAPQGYGQCMVVDGREGPRYDLISHGQLFSPDSRRVAYAARFRAQYGSSPQWCIVVDGQDGPPYPSTKPPYFSPDSRRVAYVAKRGSQWHVVVDGQAGLPYDSVETPVFSPDSRRVAYAAKRGSQWHVVVDGQAGPPCDGVFGQIIFDAPDRFHYLTRDEDDFVLIEEHLA